MTPSATPGRAAALHRRAMVRAAEGGLDDEAPAQRPSERGGAALPGAGALAIALTGLGLGLAASAVVLDRGWDPGAVAIGPWMARPRVGTPSIDPYARAALARSGAVPMAAAEGLLLTATTDSTGYRLLRTCAYRLEGGMPPARFWTLTATGADGRTLDNPARRSSFASTGVIRDAAGRAAVEVGPLARPGNWLPLSGTGPLTLELRLYGTPLTGDPAEVATAPVPSIARLGCGTAP